MPLEMEERVDSVHCRKSLFETFSLKGFSDTEKGAESLIFNGHHDLTVLRYLAEMRTDCVICIE